MLSWMMSLAILSCECPIRNGMRSEAVGSLGLLYELRTKMREEGWIHIQWEIAWRESAMRD